MMDRANLAGTILIAFCLASCQSPTARTSADASVEKVPGSQISLTFGRCKFVEGVDPCTDKLPPSQAMDIEAEAWLATCLEEYSGGRILSIGDRPIPDGLWLDISRPVYTDTSPDPSVEEDADGRLTVYMDWFLFRDQQFFLKGERMWFKQSIASPDGCHALADAVQKAAL